MTIQEAFQKIKDSFDQDAQEPKPFFPGDWGAALGILKKACGGDLNRQQVQKKLTGFAHSGDFTEGQKWALIAFVQPVKGALHWESGRGEEFERDVRVILEACVDPSKQDNLF